MPFLSVQSPPPSPTPPLPGVIATTHVSANALPVLRSVAVTAIAPPSASFAVAVVVFPAVAVARISAVR